MPAKEPRTREYREERMVSQRPREEQETLVNSVISYWETKVRTVTDVSRTDLNMHLCLLNVCCVKICPSFPYLVFLHVSLVRAVGCAPEGAIEDNISGSIVHSSKEEGGKVNNY